MLSYVFTYMGSGANTFFLSSPFSLSCHPSFSSSCHPSFSPSCHPSFSSRPEGGKRRKGDTRERRKSGTRKRRKGDTREREGRVKRGTLNATFLENRLKSQNNPSTRSQTGKNTRYQIRERKNRTKQKDPKRKNDGVHDKERNKKT